MLQTFLNTVHSPGNLENVLFKLVSKQTYLNLDELLLGIQHSIFERFRVFKANVSFYSFKLVLRSIFLTNAILNSKLDRD